MKKQIKGNNSWEKSLTILLILFLATFEQSWAEHENRVVIVSSDASVVKYSLSERSFIENIDSEVVRFDLAKHDTTSSMIKEKIQNFDPDIIYCIGSRALLFTIKELKGTPFIFSSAINWQRFGLGGNSGISAEIMIEMQLTLFKYIFPDLTDIGVVYSSRYNKEWFRDASERSGELNIRLEGLELSQTRSDQQNLNKMARKVDALWIIPDPDVITMKSIKNLFSVFEKEKKPVFSYSSAFIKEGGTLSVTVDSSTVGVQAAMMVTEIMKNHKKMGLVQDPTGSFITLNISRVNRYGLKINRNALGMINKIVKENE